MGMPIANDAYMKAYMDGYSAALERNNIKDETIVFGVDEIMKRYEVSKGKAYEIIKAIRHKCNGGLLQTEGKVLNSEVRYWEDNPDTRFKERL
jgi:hypothetical protein